jgi:hypothetical protein
MPWTSRRALSTLGALALLGTGARPIAAQETADAYGTISVTVTTLMASSFTPRSSTETYDDDLDGFRNTTGFGAGPYARFRAGLDVPSGARIEQIELEACDTDAATDVLAWLQECFGPGLCNPPIAAAVTQGSPGCVRVSALTNVLVDNRNTSYFIEVHDPSVSASTRFRAVRVTWRRQVSPAPAQATFGDVPTSHFAFRFVEALARAGITGGCTATDFCPDAPLTRAQMAVFLSVALGLHWPD